MATKVTSAKVKRTSAGGKKKSESSSASATSSSTPSTAALPMGKAMASTEKSVRDGAIQALAAYLAQTDVEPLSSLEMAKLWKGIFYCFWMSDKPRVQQALAQELADMLLSIRGASVEPAMQFLEGFFDTMVREWTGLDKWRVDKFMLLVRRFVNAAFRLLRREGWRVELVQQWSEMLIKENGGALQANDVKSPDGLMYHISNVYLEELNKVADDDDDEHETTIPVTALLQPFFNVAARCHANHHYESFLKAVIVPWTDDCAARAQELDAQQRQAKRQKRHNGRSTSNEADEDDEVSGCEYAALIGAADKTPAVLRKDAFDALFAVASRPDSSAARRRRIYKLCRDQGGLSDDDE